MNIFSKNKKEAIPKKYHYAKADISLSFELRQDGTFQLKGFLELLKLAEKEVMDEIALVDTTLYQYKSINKIERKHEYRKKFYYIKDKIALDFILRIDIDTQLKNFLGLLKSAVAEVEEDIKNQ